MSQRLRAGASCGGYQPDAIALSNETLALILQPESKAVCRP